MVTEAFKLALFRYRAQGGRLYRLAMDHGITPSMLSATVCGSRRVDYDERIIKIGEQLGLKPDECFEAEDAVAS